MTRATLRRSALAALAIAILAGAHTGVTPQGVALGATPSKPGPCVAGWQEMPVPDASLNSTPFEILAQKGKAAWALGGSTSGALVLRWKQGRWRKVSVGSGGHKGIVGGVTTSKSTVLGVGYSRPADDRLVPLIAGISSSRFRQRRVADPPGPRAALADVAKLKSGRLWAVGTRLVGGRTRGYAVRYNGKRWVRDEPTGTGKSSGLLGVTQAPSGRVWTVGWREPTIGVPRPLIARRSGGKWKIMAVAGLPAGSAVLTDVAFRSGSEGWAVGYLVETGTTSYRVILLRWDGSSWSRAALPWSGDFAAVPRALETGAAGELWIAGTQLATNSREGRGFIASLSEGSWSVARLDVPKNMRSEVLSVKRTAKGAIASGTVENSALLLRTCSGGAGSSGGAARKGALVSISAIAARKAAPAVPHIDAGESAAAESTTEGAAEDAADDSSSDDTQGSIAAATGPAAASSFGFRVRDVARQKGIAFDIATWGGFVADMNGDSRKDIFISRHKNHRPYLLLNKPGGFKQASTQAFRLVDRHGCDVADIDRDGARDVLCLVGRGRGRQINRHELSLRPGRPNGELIRGSRGLHDPFGRGREVAFLRLDDDPYPEVFMTSQPDRDDSMRARNRFFRNKDGTFVPAPGVGLDRAVGGDCLLAADIDKDGDSDLLHCVVFPDDGRPPGLRIYRNEKGKLHDRSRALGVRPMKDVDVVIKDVTGDGRRDLIQLSRTKLRVSKGTRNGFKKIYELRISDAKALAAGDASGDGRPDIYVLRGGRGNKADRLLVNRKRGRKWTSVAIPQASGGRGDDVIAFDHDKNGLTDFLVLNGFNAIGPVQLLASFRTN